MMKMSLDQVLRSAVIASHRRPFIWRAVQSRVTQRLFGRLPVFRDFYRIGHRIHPYDLAHGTETSGIVPPSELPGSELTSEKTHAYWGSQPSVVRKGLRMLPALETFTFIDLGCGKGRPLFLASEFPFRDIVGVELSSSLVAIATKNAALIQAQYPTRTRVKVQNGDAGAYRFPPGNIVVFLYNPFGQEIMKRVVTGIEEALQMKDRRVFVVYYNPVYGACFDVCPVLKRFAAANLPYAPEERGYGPDVTDAVVIWQGGILAHPQTGCNARIIITRPGHRAELVA